MGGLRRICRQFGRIKIQGVMWIWDFEANEPIKESQMTPERRKASDRAQGLALKAAYERELAEKSFIAYKGE